VVCHVFRSLAPDLCSLRLYAVEEAAALVSFAGNLSMGCVWILSRPPLTKRIKGFNEVGTREAATAKENDEVV
jgi:hypothetical protein